MSWSVGAKDITPKVGEDIERQFTSINNFPEPEEQSRQAARKIIAEVVALQTPGTHLQISAHGSQHKNWNNGHVTVSLSIVITPMAS